MIIFRKKNGIFGVKSDKLVIYTKIAHQIVHRHIPVPVIF